MRKTAKVKQQMLKKAAAIKEKGPKLHKPKLKLPERKSEVYTGIYGLPQGRADDSVTNGCLVLEGGAWRGMYTQGVLDALMEAGINLQTTIGISAGAMSAIGYLSGQIGWTASINLRYRHDPLYCGQGALKSKDHGITGFSYLFEELMVRHAFDRERFNREDRRMVVGAVNCLTGQETYFEKGQDDIFKAVQASATVPYISQPVMIGGEPYLDGGCAVKIPYHWAKREGFEKIVVVRTRDRNHRRSEGRRNSVARVEYAHYPNLVKAMENSGAHYNRICEELLTDEMTGRTFVLAPEVPVTISRFEGDMDKLGSLYYQGYGETKRQIPALKEYLGIRSDVEETV